MKDKRARKSIRTKLATIALAVVGAFSVAQVHAVPVGLELALLVDISGSVDATEYGLQKTGYVNAFNNLGIQAAIAGITGGIAVTYIEWSGAAQQYQQVGWTHLTDGTSASAFATLINNTVRGNPFNLTAPGSAINFATPLFVNNFEGLRQVIDVSGDGSENDGADTSDARDAALAGVVDTINGLAIGDATLQAFYQNNIVGGAGGTLYVANDFTDFEAAVLAKIGTEITGAPEPGTLALISLGLLGFGAVRRRAAKS